MEGGPVVGGPRSSGHVCVELLIAIALLAVVASYAFAGSSGQLRHVAASFAELRAQRMLTSRIEELKASTMPLAAGSQPFAIAARIANGLGDPRGTQDVESVEDGLARVRVRVSFVPPGGERRREMSLVTWLDREVKR